MHFLKHLWPFAERDRCTESAANEAAFRRHVPITAIAKPAPLPPAKRTWKQSPEALLKPEHAKAQNALLLALAMKGKPFTTLDAAGYLRRHGNRTVAAGKRISDLRTALRTMGVILKDNRIKLPSGKWCKEYHLNAHDVHRIRLRKAELAA